MICAPVMMPALATSTGRSVQPTPVIPPADATQEESFPHQAGPKTVMLPRPAQHTEAIKIQDPARPHHSLSPSPVERLAMPMNSVAARRKRARKAGTAAQVYQYKFGSRPLRRSSFVTADASVFGQELEVVAAGFPAIA